MKKIFTTGVNDERKVAEYLLVIQRHVKGEAFRVVNVSEMDKKNFTEISAAELKYPMLYNTDEILKFFKEKIENFFREENIVAICYGRPEERSLNSIALSNLLDFDS